jgi:serine/threonine-protein phosphatase 5
VGSDGELEEEVDMDRIITDQDREQAAELKVKANKAFAGRSLVSFLLGMSGGSGSKVEIRGSGRAQAWMSTFSPLSYHPFRRRADKSAKEFNQSIDLYSEAIALNPKDSTLWNNRGMSKSRMEEHGAAIADASMSIFPSFCSECILTI